MDKIKIKIRKVKKYGIGKAILFLIITVFYHIAKPFYLFYAQHIAKVDDNQILFMSSPSYSGNAKALYDYLMKNEDKYHFVWLFNKDDKMLEDTARTKFVRRRVQLHYGFTLSSLGKIATSKYLFFTHRSPLHEIKKKDGQLIINLWHGCGYKAAEESKTSWIKEDPFDYALVPGELFISTKKDFWDCREDQILPIGYPRYDFLMSESEQGQKFIENIRGNEKRLLIWMPTFRDTGEAKFPEEKIKASFDIPLMNSLDEMIELDQFCEKSHVVLCVKRHVFQLRYSCEDVHFHNIKFISNDDLVKAGVELYSILRYTDALISDYSSAAIDYLLLNKPIAFCLDDFEDYKNARGFVFEDPLAYMPGHHLYQFDDMKQFIKDVAEEKDPYREERERLLPQVQNPCDHYCERVWETVQKL